MTFFSQNLKADNNTYTVLNDTIKTKSDTAQYFFPRNYLYIELAGLGLYYSINYERSILSENNNNISLRVGGSYISFGMSDFKDVLFGINYNKFLYNKLLFNTGINILFWKFGDYAFSSTTYNYGTYLAINLGINYIPKNHFFIKPNALFFFTEKGAQPYFGLSIGFKFGKH